MTTAVPHHDDPRDPGEPGDREAAHMRREQRQVMRERARERWCATVPPTFENAPATDVHPGVKRWVTEQINATDNDPTGQLRRGTSLLMTGGYGTGKTHSAWWAVGKLAAAGVIAAWEFITMTDLYAACRPRPNVDAEAVFRRFAAAPLLVLDDVGAFKQSAWTLEIDYRLINHRHDFQRPTILTTNLPPARVAGMPGDVETLADLLDLRVLSRLTAMCGDHVLSPGLGDRRRDGAT